MLDDALLRLNFIDVDRVALEVKEVTDEYRLILLVSQCCVFLEEVVVALSCGELQCCDSLRVPSMLDAVLAPVELTKCRQEDKLVTANLFLLFYSVCLVMQFDGITGDGLQSNTANC